jgi:zinc transporter
MSICNKKIKAIYLDGHGNGIEKEVENINELQGLFWIKTSITSVKELLKKMECHMPLVSEVLSSRNTRPRVLVSDDGLLANFRGVNSHNASVSEDMISVRLWIHNNLIITVQRFKLSTVSAIERSLQQGLGPKTPAEFLETLLEGMTDKSTEVVANLGDKLDAIEDNLSESPDDKNRIELSDIRRKIILLRRYLIPQREAISHISTYKISWLNENNIIRLHEITNSNIRLLEDLNAERERSTVIYEELCSQAQEIINQKMYLLTIIAVIFMPLSFLTGLLGINIEGIPGAKFRYGFLIVCLLLALVFIIQIFFLKKKKWF